MHTSFVVQAPGQGRALLFKVIAQSGPGTTCLVPADATKRVKVVSYIVVLSDAGTIKFTDSDGDLTGAMPILGNGGISAPGQASSHWFETGIAKALYVVTTGGSALGHLAYFLEPPIVTNYYDQ